MANHPVESKAFPQSGERLYWLDALKAMAAFGVVMTHIASINWQASVPPSFDWFTASVYEIATRFAVPVFFMASGAFLLNPNKVITINKIYKRLVPHALFATITASVLFVLLESYYSGWTGWRSFLHRTIDGPYFIWYMWVLIGLYALTPILRVIASGKKLLTYTLILLGVFVIGKATVLSMAPESDIAALANNFIIFSPDMEGIFYYLMGAWLVSHRLSKQFNRVIICGGFTCLVVAIGLNYIDACNGSPDLYYVARNNLLIAFFSIGFFQLIRTSVCFQKKNPLVAFLVKYALYIYLIHPFFRLVMESEPVFEPVVSFMLNAPLFGIPLVSIAIYLITVMLSVILKRVVSAVYGPIRKSIARMEK